jgi:hypothetical protein
MNFNDVVRALFYLDELLFWYDDFDSACNNYFMINRVYDNIKPASTVTSEYNYGGSALLTGAYVNKSNNTRNKKIDISMIAFRTIIESKAVAWNNIVKRIVYFECIN